MRGNMKNSLKNRTLARCGIGVCPAVYDNEDGTFTIVGDKVTPDPELAPHVAEHERAINISATLVAEAVFSHMFRAGPAGLRIEDYVLMLVRAPKGQLVG